MAAATTTMGSLGRGPSPVCTVAAISVTVVASATTYATASGGLPFDLTSVLQAAAPAGWDAPFGIQAINPADIVGASFLQLSTNKYLPTQLVIGTPTYTPVPWQSDNGIAAEPGYLQTCPCTIRLFGTGTATTDGFNEVPDGAVTDTFTFTLLINRNGANN